MYKEKRASVFGAVTILFMVMLFSLCITRFVFLSYLLDFFSLPDFFYSFHGQTIRLLQLNFLHNYGMWDMYSNVGIFIPVGIIYSFYSVKKGSISLAFSVLITTVFIELMQFVLKTGVSDINDVVFNLLGGVIGIIIYRIIYICCKKEGDRANDVVAVAALIFPPHLFIYLFDMFLLLDERYEFEPLHIVGFVAYYVAVQFILLKDKTLPQIIAYYIAALLATGFFLFVFMR